MPRVSITQNSFTSGEIDPLIEGRADTQQYAQAAAKMRNVFILPQGGVRRRPGLEFIADLGTVATLSDVRIIPFRISDTRDYLVVLDGNSSGQVYDATDGSTFLASFTNKFTAAQLPNLTWAQDGPFLLLFHKDKTMQIFREIFGAPNTWAMDDKDIENQQQFSFQDTTTGGVDHVEEIRMIGLSDGSRYTVFLDGEESGTVVRSFTASVSASNLQTALRAMDVTAAAGLTVADAGASDKMEITFTGGDGKREWSVIGGDGAFDDDAGTIVAHTVTKGNPDQEDAWSSTRGFARAGGFSQGRFLVMGSRELPQTLFSTKSGSITDWNDRLSADDFGFQLTADTDDINVFRQMFVGRHVQIFSDNGEFYLPNSEDEIMTPDNVVIRKTGSRGIIEGVPVIGVDGATLYIDSTGTSLREFLFTDGEAAYDSTNLSLLAAHLLATPKAMAFHKSSASDTPDLVLIVNKDDFSLAVFSTLRDQQVAGWSLCTTSGGSSAGGFYDVVNAADTMWFITQRDIDGDKKFYLERFNDDLHVDIGKFAVDLGAPVSTGTGLAHLNGVVSKVIIDNTVQPDDTPSAGSVTFPRDATDSWQVGLAWPVVDGDKGIVHIQLLPISASLPEGASDQRKRRIVEVTVRLFETSEMEINGKPVAFRDIKSPLDDPIPKFTGFKFKTVEGWGDEGRVNITQTEHLPMTILSVTRKVGI